MFKSDPVCLRYQMIRDHRLRHLSSVFDLRLMGTKPVALTDSHYEEDDR